MNLPAGTRVGPYDILSAIGAGGMGEVYRARDAKLNRDVAIKVLLQSVAADPDRVARFRREAQVLASLNHPNIAHIHGIEETDGVTALVLELVEGEDLAARIARGPLPLDEALPIARQIAGALEAAHELGIIHRDLKPANVKVRPDGTVKVLDFGLAKATEPPGSTAAAAVANSPTLTSPAMMTGVGVILGTAAYMSPEQAKGRVADKRGDVWAFGCVLYEMLTSRRAFDGEDMTEVLGAVVRLEPDWGALPTDVPQPIRVLLHSCLIKDPRHRVSDVSTAVFVLDKVVSLVPAQPMAGLTTSDRGPFWKRLVTPAIAAVAAGVIVAPAVWFAARRASGPPPLVSRLLITPAADTAISTFGNNLAITPDGTRLAYVGNSTQLFVRRLDALEPEIVSTGDSLRGPFASPDSQWIGFMDAGSLRKVAVTGGPTVTVATLDGAARGAAWISENTMIVATSNAATGLQRIDLADGVTTNLTQPNRVQGEGDHVWPEPLPGGAAVLFTIVALSGGLDASQVAVLDLQTGKYSIIVRGGRHARYVPSPTGSIWGDRSQGHLVYAAADGLYAVAFDLANLKTSGTPIPMVPKVAGTQFGAVDAVVSGNGTLAYSAGNSVGERALVWVDRKGHETPIATEPRPYVYPRLSPDGLRVVMTAVDRQVDIWLWELARPGLTRVTTDPSVDHAPMWTADGRRLIFSSDRLGTRNLFWQMADGTGATERIGDSRNRQSATGVSPDGRHVIVTEASPTTTDDVMQVELSGAYRVTPLVQTTFVERNGVVSPNGRWLAYETNDAGRFEIWVRPYPDVNSGRWQVSTDGGTRPLWARNGNELFYVSLTSALMRVGVESGASWATTAATQLIGGGYLLAPPIDIGRSYDISLDGQRFLMIKDSSGSTQPTASRSIIVVQHWAEELKRLVPTK